MMWKPVPPSAAYEHKGPVYISTGCSATPVINDTPDYKFELGKGIILRDGTDITIVATGLMVAEALDADILQSGISGSSTYTIKPRYRSHRQRS